MDLTYPADGTVIINEDRTVTFQPDANFNGIYTFTYKVFDGIAKSNIATQQTTLELATEVSRLEQLRYDTGRGDIDNLLKSKSGQSMAEASLAEARHNLLIALNSLQLTIEGECR